SAVEIPPDLGRSFTRLLDRRAAALLSGDRVTFAQGLARSDETFLIEQAAYFDNLRHLPIRELSFDLDPRKLVRSGDDYWGVVEVTLQLAGFDREPVVTLDRYRFSPLGDNARRFGLSSVTDAGWEARNDVSSQPWDTGPIQVRAGVGVLGIFDAESVRESDALIDSVERGIGDVAALVPYDWSRSVVVYALSDTEFLSSIEDPPGGHPERLDGVAFPVEVSPTSDETAATRFVLHPRMLDRARAERDRLVRHELTHVAMGEHDDHAPVWLSEGLAEYVSVRPLAPQDRMIADTAIAAAKAGEITELPDDGTFNGADSAVHYSVAWWACEYLAGTFGQASLWTILDGFETTDAESGPDGDDTRLEDMTGINSRTLARKAAKLMIATFDPGYDPTPQPTTEPTREPTTATDEPDVETD
ncbi:MAG: basic secretory family protein, partial [Actinomycetota bacterium]|nr:basic secretory family protein [Actinomycetota bacterium]